MADLTSALVPVPGTRNASVYPAHAVMSETWAPERTYAVEQIENWPSAGGKRG